MKKITSLVLCILYLLSSSVFFHAHAMDIVVTMSGPCDCAMGHHNEATTTDNNCFEICLGAYDEASSTNIKEEYKISHKYIFDGKIANDGCNDFTVFDSSLCRYRQLIDSGGDENTLFHNKYIKVTKRLE